MAINSPRTPKYQRHKASNQGYVALNGKRIYLGVWGKPETEQAYHRLIGEWLSNGRRLRSDPEEITVIELIAAFMVHAREYYRRVDGTPTSEPENFRQAVKPLKELYGPTRCADFGPMALKAVREKMVGYGWARPYINSQVSRLRMVFKWAVENEMVTPSILHGMQAVGPLKRGRTHAAEPEPVKPVPDAHIEAVKPRLSRQVKAMVELQTLTGMRPTECCILRTGDLDTTGTVWTYTPSDHKTAHHGHERTIYVGPKGQDVLRPFLKADLAAYVFSPRDAEEERREAQHAARVTPMSCGNKPGSNRKGKPKVEPGERYDVNSYRRAIHRACDKAGVPPLESEPPAPQRRDDAKARARPRPGPDDPRPPAGIVHHRNLRRGERGQGDERDEGSGLIYWNRTGIGSNYPMNGRARRAESLSRSPPRPAGPAFEGKDHVEQ